MTELSAIFREADERERKRRKRARSLPKWCRRAAKEVHWIRRNVLCYDDTDIAIAIHGIYLESLGEP